MTPSAYDELMRVARRHCRRAEEAEDLLQDALLDAVAAGRGDLPAPADRRWLVGVIRNKAVFQARGAARRRSRETAWAASDEPADAQPAAMPVAEMLKGLPPSLKAVAALALSGHSRREIAYLLRLSDVALRQRLTGLKRELKQRGITMPDGTPGLSLDLAYGRIRDALLPALIQQSGVFASHDPDGHLFIIRHSQKG